MKVNLMSSELKESNNAIDIAEGFIDAVYNESLIHQVVTGALTNARSGTKAQKTRAQVSGGGAKPWKQKGSGRARAGSSRSPIWRKGGKVFAAVPKDYNVKVNKKMYAGAMRSIISELYRTGRLIVVEEFNINQPKTKDLLKILKPYLDQRIMLITQTFDMDLFLSSRNLKNVYMVDVGLIDPVSLVDSDKVFITKDALKDLEECFV